MISIISQIIIAAITKTMPRSVALVVISMKLPPSFIYPTIWSTNTIMAAPHRIKHKKFNIYFLNTYQIAVISKAANDNIMSHILCCCFSCNFFRQNTCNQNHYCPSDRNNYCHSQTSCSHFMQHCCCIGRIFHGS